VYPQQVSKRGGVNPKGGIIQDRAQAGDELGGIHVLYLRRNGKHLLRVNSTFKKQRKRYDPRKGNKRFSQTHGYAGTSGSKKSKNTRG